MLHDLRVWSRRSQQIIRVLQKQSPLAQRTLRELRRARRAVGPWRDCDVVIDLLERKWLRARNPEEKAAWERVRELALDRRVRAIRRGRRKLANLKILRLKQLRDLVTEVMRGIDSTSDLHELLLNSITRGYELWREALTLAEQTGAPRDIHAFRIQTKHLRYRIEFARDLGDSDAKGALMYLRRLQDQFGRWHDRSGLAQLTAEALADPQFLSAHAPAVRVIVRKLAKQQVAGTEENKLLLARVRKDPEKSTLEAWLVRSSGQPTELEEVQSSDLSVKQTSGAERIKTKFESSSEEFQELRERPHPAEYA